MTDNRVSPLGDAAQVGATEVDAEQTPGARTDPERPTTRVQALDVARGLMLVVSVAVNAWFIAPAWFQHAPWAGVHPIDLVFPAFVTLTGAGLGIAYARRVRWRRELRRAVVLLGCGLAYNVLAQYLADGTVTWGTFRLTGVLQLYALVVLGMAVLGAVVRRWWHWAVIALGLAAAQTALFRAWGRSCAGGVLTPDCNPSLVIDTAVFSAAHVYAGGARGHDPEGLVVLLGALTTATVGATAGRLMLEHHRDGRTRVFVARMAGCWVGLVLAAVMGSLVVEPFKRLWTTPFALGVAAAVGLVLVLLHLLLDGRPVPRGEAVARFPLVSLGRNSLLVYFGSHAVMMVLLGTGPGPEGEPWAVVLAAALGNLVGDPAAVWPFCVAAVAAWTVLAMVLHRREIYIKA